jgi:hypothetical protein
MGDVQLYASPEEGFGASVGSNNIYLTNNYFRVGGTGGNYTEFETDGTMVANGNATVWEDLNFDPDRS